MDEFVVDEFGMNFHPMRWLKSLPCQVHSGCIIRAERLAQRMENVPKRYVN